MNKTLTLYILASLVFVAVSYAGEPGPALAQLENMYTGGVHSPLTDPFPTSQPWDSPWTPGQHTGEATEDCFMQDGVEVCIAPNWPDCEANGDVEPCIDHVQQPFCLGDAIPTWVSFTGNGNRHQGCFYPSSYYPEAADKALLLRAEKNNLSVLLRGRKVVFSLGAAKKSLSRGYFTGFNSETWWQEFFENDPCHGLMACYNQGNAALLQAILDAEAGAPYHDYTQTVTVGQPSTSGGR